MNPGLAEFYLSIYSNEIMTPEQAIKNLKEGNARHAAGIPKEIYISPELRTNLFTKGQYPYAAIVCCSDSRVPVELVFNAGPGELFIVRTAGNVVGLLEMGSLEFAISQFKTPLVLVLGHQQCGAVRASLDGGEYSPAINAILQEIRSHKTIPAPGDIYEMHENENIRHTLSKIAANPNISKFVSDGSVRLAAAKYSLETGRVTFFD